MSRGRRRAGGAMVVLAGLLLVLLGSLLGWRLWPSDEVGAAAGATRAAAPDHPPASAGGAPAASVPPASRPDVAPVLPSEDATPVEAAAPLPPVDTPLAQVREELEARARRGERRAACRLALDGDFCRANPLDVDTVAFFEQAIARRGRTTAEDVAWIAHLEAEQQRARQLCRDLPPGWLEQQAWRYMLQAAQAGDHALAARFAIAPPLNHGTFIENAEPWLQYSRLAPELLQRAAAAGERHAIWFLQRLLRGDTQLQGMPNAIPRDARQAAIYAVALRAGSTGGTRSELEQALAADRAAFPAAEWQAIEREGEALAARHFARLPPHDFQAGMFRDVDVRHCEE